MRLNIQEKYKFIKIKNTTLIILFFVSSFTATDIPNSEDSIFKLTLEELRNI